MYFHLIGIIEKNGKQEQVDFLITGGDIEFIRGFLSQWGVVIVSIEQYKEDPSVFGRIFLTTTYKKTNIKILTEGDKLEDRLYFYAFLGFPIENINFTDTPLSNEQIQRLIQKTLDEIKDESEKIKQAQEAEIQKENKKYEESGIEKCLEALNNAIIRLDQLKKAGAGIISGSDLKALADYEDNIKKIRLGTNFNKMASLLINVQSFSKKIEDVILTELGDKKFAIDRNSYVTNIDVINENFNLNTVREKSTFQVKLDTKESVYLGGGTFTLFAKFLTKDIISSFKNSEINELFTISMNILEVFVAVFLICFTLIWLIGPYFIDNNFSVYYLPTFGWLGLLLYLFNSLNLKSVKSQILTTIVLISVYWIGLQLLKGTFAI